MSTPPKHPLSRRISVDPNLARTDRMAIALAMSADQFSVDDIARVTSVRRQTIVGLRERSGLPPRPPGKAAVHVNRSLEPVVSALAKAAATEFAATCRRLGIHQVSGWGILLAIQYTAARDERPDLPRMLRCPGCEQITSRHPCQYCETAWLVDEGSRG